VNTAPRSSPFCVIGVETSCDETAVAVVEDGVRVRSNVVASSQEFHRRFGGVVPEIASRKQVELIGAVAQQALDESGVDWASLGAAAVTYAPGLVGSLVVGVCFAKALAWARSLPLVAVHHIEAHIYAHFLSAAPPGAAVPHDRAAPEFPFLALVVSGGHSDLVAVQGHGEFQVLGRTRDDAAGEAFDKGARLLGLGYPGGPAIDAAARQGDRRALAFPRAVVGDEAGPGRSRWDFSFSGVKTALARYLRETQCGTGAPACPVNASQPRPALSLPNGAAVPHCTVQDLAASYQEAVVEPLVEKSLAAAQSLGFERLLVAGGVANNSRLRALMAERAAEAGVETRFPPPELCTDNGAMVASAGYFRYLRGDVAGLDLDARASADLNRTAV
jgi:N6-L-threonylcarbamoyladenine synthase